MVYHGEWVSCLIGKLLKTYDLLKEEAEIVVVVPFEITGSIGERFHRGKAPISKIVAQLLLES